jgi:hypothetical protein
MVLIYRTSMHASSALSPKMCTRKIDKNARLRWLHVTLQQLDQHQPTTSPQNPHVEDETIEEQIGITQHQDGELPPNDRGQHTIVTTEDHGDLRNGTPFIPVSPPTGAPTRLSVGTPAPSRVPLRTNSSPAVHTTRAHTTQENRFDLLAEQGSTSCDRVSERLSFGSLSGAYSRASSAMNIRGRDPIPITPEILHLLDRLEPYKGK